MKRVTHKRFSVAFLTLAAVVAAAGIGNCQSPRRKTGAPAVRKQSPLAAFESGQQFYVAPDGSPTGSGSEADPWDLATALAGPAAVKPGDTIWLQGGEYGTGKTVFTSKLAGTIQKPMLVRQRPGEAA
jgi:hypothetical protein